MYMLNSYFDYENINPDHFIMINKLWDKFHRVSTYLSFAALELWKSFNAETIKLEDI